MKKLALILAMALSTSAYAGELVDVDKGMQGRMNHEMLYADDCEACHTGDAKKFVDDSSCIACHGEINEIELDTEKLVMPEANPHKSVHYNQGASCLACHAEHQTKKPVCSECHRTWFDEM
ncbi:cytochrome c3 family protein [Ferrimonas lipolytica]|uniref:Cytochrome c3 family protein n=1 Tax=Ferrimonas lipolytica TaxID=2724191 RepID=A0A6H1UGK4_9GAMM|nr:cytochrome c3 family protein [Ferrimonas lipolytica]QIZ78174.1 cytochrome c3 family protein [Ferrimonas lipolytica]